LNFGFLNSIILAGILQGFFFGTLYLYSKKYKSEDIRYLALLILSFSYNNLQFYISDIGLITGAMMYKTLYIPMGTLIPVFIYFYVLEFTNSLHKSKGKKLLYFLPFLIFTLNVFIYKVWSIFAQPTNIPYYIFKFINDVQSIFSAAYTLVLLLLSYIQVRRYSRNYQGAYKSTNENSSWLKQTLLLLFALTILWSYALFNYIIDASYRIYFQILWVGLSLTIYWLGHFGVFRYGVKEERKSIRRYASRKSQHFTPDLATDSHIEKFENILKIEKRFLHHRLTLEDIAQELNISKGHLSRIINAELETNFTDYVNKLRVEESKKHLINPEFSKYTLAAIGLEAGFSSKSNFNTVFKKQTGYTPSQFKNK